MFNSIIKAIQNFGFTKAVVEATSEEEDTFDLNAELELYEWLLQEENEFQQKAIDAEWKAKTEQEQREVFETIDELVWRGIGTEHRFYAYWKAVQRN